MMQIILLLNLKRPDKHERLTQREESQITKIHQAIAMIQFKLEIRLLSVVQTLKWTNDLYLKKLIMILMK